ncbi:MAG: ASKHA domain-containing protein [Chloroflexota bacterium]
MNLEVDFEPIGRRVVSKRGETLLAAAQHAGIVLNAPCGGEGTCGHCVVQVADGQVSPPNGIEMDALGHARIAAGLRLACQTEVWGMVRIHLPPESLATAQRTQTEGHNLPLALSPAVQAIEITVPPPTLDDLDSDAARLRRALRLPHANIPVAVLRALPEALRTHPFRLAACVRHLQGPDACVAGLYPPGTPPLGLAVDLGTTKLAAYLVNLADGETLATAGAMNPQIAFGEDVMARINHATARPAGGEQLRAVIVETLNVLADDLCSRIGHTARAIVDAVIVGNTAMHHLLLGLPVKQLGVAPYVPAESAALDLGTGEIGLDFAPGANVHLLPNIAGFVGADHVAMLLGAGMLERPGIVLGMDIGTNTEISLIAHGQHFACSTASGPAFEGAHIRCGMRAAAGAIEKVAIRAGQISLQTIDHQPPVGLCGSGILDLVAEMRKSGLLQARGAFNLAADPARMHRDEQGAVFVLVAAEENNGVAITFSRKDVNEIQLAKGAMRAGIDMLLQKARVEEKDIDTVVIAGAFGTYLDVQSGIEIGMFPRLDAARFVQVGNAAGVGARMALLSLEKRQQASEIARRVEYVELTTEKDFSSIYTTALMLE